MRLLRLVLLIVIVSIGRLLIFLAGCFQSRPSAASMAVTILDICKKTWDRDHELVPADPANFPHCAIGFYNTAQAELEAVGFRYMADWQNITLADVSPDAIPTFVREMLSANGEVSAGIYQFTYNATIENGDGDSSEEVVRKIFLVEFETEFTDGTFMSTGPVTEEDKTGEVPGIMRLLPPFEMTNVERYEYHAREVANYCEKFPDVRPVVMKTEGDLRASGARSHDVKRKYRKSIGWLTKAELIAMSDGDDDEMTEKIWQEIQRLNGRSTRP